jgi:3-deoxy-D-manno-octulosonic-acid transferase
MILYWNFLRLLMVVIVVSTIDMLNSLYAIADIDIVGGDLINNFGSIGQHNVMEPLREGCPVICGTHGESILCNDITIRLKAHNDPNQDEDEIQYIVSFINLFKIRLVLFIQLNLYSIIE